MLLLGRKSIGGETQPTTKHIDSFMEDLKSIVYVEAIFMDEQRQGDYFLACSCVNEKSESGVKGRLGSSRRT